MSKSSRKHHGGAGIRSEPLEPRLMFYATSGLSWAATNISYSFMPDGTVVTSTGTTSQLFAGLNAIAPADVWQREFARALQTWANHSPLNFRLVADDGSPRNTWGLVQGDPRFGDIRFGAQPLGAALASAYGPSNKGATPGGTGPGEVFLNTQDTYRIGSDWDLYSVLVHEIGHALGLAHSGGGGGGSVMADTYHGVLGGLTADDIAGIQAIYGVRLPDAYDAARPNDGFADATVLSITASRQSFVADLTSQADADFYRFTVPDGVGAAKFTVDARGLSLLAPRLIVYDAAGNLVASASSGGAYGGAATASVAGLVAGETYTILADGAGSDVFGMGAYALSAQFASPRPIVTEARLTGGTTTYDTPAYDSRGRRVGTAETSAWSRLHARPAVTQHGAGLDREPGPGWVDGQL